jgi:carboxyl-terminal processing protease
MKLKRLAIISSLATLPLAVGAFMLQGQVQATLDGPRLFARVKQMVEQHAVDSLSNTEIYELAARGLVKNLNDPYADLYSPQQLASFQRNTLGNNYGGVGMQIESQDGLITVTRVFPGTPGEMNGVQAGDRIMQVDTTAVTGMKLEDVSGRLTGQAGTKVNVTFAREGVSEPIRVTFTRAIIRVPAVPYTIVLDNGVGYLPLQRFNENAAEQVEQGLQQLRSKGARSYLIDLRGNPGGSLDQSLEISNLFLKPGVEIASVRHRGKTPEVYRANRPSIVDSASVVVLIDQYSASASEIVAGALQDQDRALVVGTSSFGKGLVQTLFPLEGGWAIKLTTGKWYTPSGRSIQGEHKQYADGRFVEYAPDTAETDSARKARPKFKSASGRVVYGGGGVTPDVIVKPDTLSTVELEFLKAVAVKQGVIYNTVYAYARELRNSVKPDFTVQPAWRDELYNRLIKAEVKVDRKQFDAAEPLINRLLEERVTRIAFGDSAWVRRSVPEDQQLVTALDFLKKGRNQRELLAMAAREQGSSH